VKNVWTVAKREFNMYFASPIAYVSAFLVLLPLGIYFYGNLAVSSQFGGTPQPTQTVGLFVVLMLFFIPVLTMRLLAEEQRTGTIELLLTAPVREWELVAGKWLAAFGFVALLIFFTGTYPLILNNYTTPSIDVGAALVAYAGLLIMGAAMLSVGVFFSTLFANQIAAYFATMAVLLALWLMQTPLQNATGPVANFLSYLIFPDHYYNNFINGVVDLGDLVYFLSVIVLFLFLAARSVESRRWR
jgi:ABC-2 type transport system permease protein